MRRLIGALIVIFGTVLFLIVNNYYFLLAIDNELISLIRRMVYILKILFGKNFLLVIISIVVVGLPLIFNKSVYSFFKNLAGVEIFVLSVSSISNLEADPLKIASQGVIPYDISSAMSNLFGTTITAVILGGLVILSLYLMISCYKFPKTLLGYVLVGLSTLAVKVVESINSLKNAFGDFFDDSSTNKSYQPNYQTPTGNTKSKKSSKSHESSSGVSRKGRDDEMFIDIEVLDEIETGFEKTRFKRAGSEDSGYPFYPLSNPLIINQDAEEKDFSGDLSDGIDRVSYYQEDKGQEDKKNEEVFLHESKVYETEIIRTELTEKAEDKIEYTDEIDVGSDSFFGQYPPPLDLLDKTVETKETQYEEILEIEKTKQKISDTFAEFKIEATIEGFTRGPVVTLYEIKPQPGTKIAKIVNLSDNLALNLATSGVRIVYPIPGKSVIGIEVPNKIRKIVKLREIIESQDYRETKARLPLVIGKNIHGRYVIEDLTQMPHLLIAGSTGSGKSVYVNSIISGLLYAKHPNDLKFIMIDLKIVELKIYNGIPHLVAPVITTPKLAKAVLEWLVDEMQYRYRKLESLGCRDINQYNTKVSKLEMDEKLPYIVLIIDEYADLMMTSPKETEDYITRLAAMSRAVGIHLIIATQRPSVDVVTGIIKANFPARVAFRVASKVDSRTILDTIGAEKLLGRGDLLFMSPSSPVLSRVQGPYISNEEVERIVEYLSKQDTPHYIDLSSKIESKEDETFDDNLEDEFSDELYKQALEIVIREKKASASYLQRRLKIGYNRAARIIEKMEEEGIVGPQQGVKPREVLVGESYLERFL